jgi:hypothetical protein
LRFTQQRAPAVSGCCLALTPSTYGDLGGFSMIALSLRSIVTAPAS